MNFHFQFTPPRSPSGFLTNETRKELQKNERRLKIAAEYLDAEPRPLPPFDKEALRMRFDEAAAKGEKGIQDAFAAFRDKIRLVQILTFRPKQSESQASALSERRIVDVPFFLEVALRLFESQTSVRLFRALCMEYLSNWSEFRENPKAEARISRWLKESLAALKPRFARRRWLRMAAESERFIFNSTEGMADLAKALRALEKNENDDAARFFESRPSGVKQDSGLPFFLTIANARDFWLESFVTFLKSLGADLHEGGKIYGKYLNIARTHAEDKNLGRDAMLRILAACFDGARSYISGDEGLRGTIKELALRYVGDPIRRSKWLRWPGASVEDENTVEELRSAVNMWIMENMMAIFFEVLFKNDARRNFWRPYIPKMSGVHIFCNSGDKMRLRNDPRFDDNMDARFGNLARNIMVAVLVMEIGDHVLIEVSSTGHAFYIYKRENLKTYDLLKLRDALDYKPSGSFTMNDFKYTQLPRIGPVDADKEGKFFHFRDWESELERWLFYNLNSLAV
ncbi:MAG: hypothetical protein LBQ42_11075 [Synergistaceae bacterium]|nr:hypothetical protein [Synergistaceae bacterium]